MRYVILEKAKPYTRTRKGRFEHVKGYPSKGKLSREDALKMIPDRKKLMIDRVTKELETWKKKHPHDSVTAFHGTSADKIYKILFEGIRPQKNFHNFDPDFYEGERSNRIFVCDDFTVAQSFAHTAQWKSGSPAIILEVIIPADEWKKAKLDSMSMTGYMLPEVKPEWIKNVYDMDKNPMTKTINSLTLQRFEKAGRKVYIPVLLGVLKKILGGKKYVRNNSEIR